MSGIKSALSYYNRIMASVRAGRGRQKRECGHAIRDVTLRGSPVDRRDRAEHGCTNIRERYTRVSSIFTPFGAETRGMIIRAKSDSAARECVDIRAAAATAGETRRCEGERRRERERGRRISIGRVTVRGSPSYIMRLTRKRSRGE